MEQSWRGQIRDRNGTPLALTVPAKNVYADLTVWTNRVDLLARIVAPLLGTDQTKVAQRVRQSLSARKGQPVDQGPGVLLLKRGLTAAEWTPITEALVRESFGFRTNKLSSRERTQLKGLRRWTLFAEDDQRRYFPHGDSLAHVLGFVGSGTNGHLLQGKGGVERALDHLLAGQNGGYDSNQDAAGNELAFCRTSGSTVRDGVHVGLTIDLTLQGIVEDALAKVVSRYNPRNASCVVVRPSSGEILAAGQPADVLPPRAWQQPAGGVVESCDQRPQRTRLRFQSLHACCGP